MDALNWEEFKKILNVVDKEHSVKLTPTSKKGIVSGEDHGYNIRYVVPVLDMGDNKIFTITFYMLEGNRKIFSTIDRPLDAKRYDKLIDEVMEWLNSITKSEV